MSEVKRYDRLKDLIDIILKMDRNDLRQLRNMLYHMQVNESFTLRNDFEIPFEESARDKDKQQLIGVLPYVLLNKHYFPTNSILVVFAKRNLNIEIKSPQKKSREEIIGSIVAEVIKKEPTQIRLFVRALEQILGKQRKGTIKNFFLEWDRIIRST
jgi:hypothetical protein